jgi:hypothetical protein
MYRACNGWPSMVGKPLKVLEASTRFADDERKIKNDTFLRVGEAENDSGERRSPFPTSSLN